MVLVLLVAALAWPLTAPSAQAEDLLVTSDPYKHQELSDPPSWVTLAFTRAVDAAAAQIVVTNTAGKSVNINSLVVEGTNVAVQVKGDLPKDTYTVHWQVNRKDGQVEGGAFQFSYGKGTWTKLDDERWSGNSAQPTVIASAEPDPVGSTASPTATPTATDTAVSPSATPTEAASGAAPDASGSGSGATPWLWGGGAVLVAAAAGAIVWTRRKKPSA